MADEREFPKVDGDVLYASEVNKLNSAKEFKWFFPNAGNYSGIIKHSSTTWAVIGAANTTRTTDSGVTWSNVTGDDAAMDGPIAKCIGTPANALVGDNSSNAIYRTTDSSANWTAETTPPASATAIETIAYPTSGVAVCGTTGGTRTIFRSTDQGDTWTVCTTGPTNPTLIIGMLDGTTGFAIDSSSNIWKTTDGGDNWTDTTHNMGSGNGGNMLVLTSSTFIANMNNSGNEILQYYDGSTVENRLSQPDTGSYDVSPIILANNGKYYMALNSIGDNVQNVMIMKSDDGNTWDTVIQGPPCVSALTANGYAKHANLAEGGDSKLLFGNSQRGIIEIDESWDA